MHEPGPRLTWMLLPLLLSATACIRPHGPEDLRAELSRSSGVELDRETGLTITRSGMVLARWGMRVAGEDDISLSGVRRLEVGVYRVDDREGQSVRPSLLQPPAMDGWETVIRLHEEDEDVLLVVEPDGKGRVRRLVLVVAGPDEWVLVRMRGKLDRMLEQAVELAFNEAGRPELYAVAPREPGWEPPG